MDSRAAWHAVITDTAVARFRPIVVLRTVARPNAPAAVCTPVVCEEQGRTRVLRFLARRKALGRAGRAINDVAGPTIASAPCVLGRVELARGLAAFRSLVCGGEGGRQSTSV